jgi:hypothetical protein
VQFDGAITTLETPNPPEPSGPLKAEARLSPADTQRLRSILRSDEFVNGMAHGFACGGTGWDVNITFIVRLGGELQRQFITTCVSGRDSDNAPRQLVDLLMPYRLVTKR